MEDEKIAYNEESEKLKKEQMSSTVEENSNTKAKFDEEVLGEQGNEIFKEKEDNVKAEQREETYFVKTKLDISRKSGFL